MILHNVNIITSGKKNISIDGEKITAITATNDAGTVPAEMNIYFDNCIAFPGLINSHDHLDFNLFPQLGNKIYQSYMQWGADIHVKNKAAIQAVLNIPQALRTQWGIYKNLINGCTTVVQHGGGLVTGNAPIHVFTHCNSLHSVGLEKGWRYKLNNPFIKPYPFVIHIGEGIDTGSHEEINSLLRWNLFKRKLIGIHGVAMNRQQAGRFEALIWCPATNFFLLGKTAGIGQIKTATNILFGTDSTLSAGWNIWKQLRQARETGLLTDDELMASVSSVAAGVWQLNGTGTLKENNYADIVVTEKKSEGNNDADAFFASNPKDILLILNRGAIILFDASLLPQLSNIKTENYSKVFISNKCKYVIGNLPALIKEIKKHSPETILPVEIE